METQKIGSQTDLTILAKLDSSNQVQLFLLDSLTVLSGDDKVKDTFGSGTRQTSVSVRVVSTDATVTVTNTGSTGPTWTTTSLSSSDVTLYVAMAAFDIPAEGSGKVKDSFTIAVGGNPADPTVVIERGGSGSNVAVGSVRGR